VRGIIQRARHTIHVESSAGDAHSAMKHRSRNLFLLRFNNRNDNLGDQIIFTALVDALKQHGILLMHGQIPPFVEGVRPAGGKWRSLVARAATKAGGGSVVQVLAPGALLWSHPDPPPTRSSNTLRKRMGRWLAGRTISIGQSVIDGADHSWCKHVDWIGVRDDNSRRALHQAGFTQVSYFPDLSFLLRSHHAPTRGQNRMAFSFRSRIPEDRNSSEYERTIRNAFADIVGSLSSSDRGYAVGFHQVHQDGESVAQLCEEHGLRHVPAMLTLPSHQTFYQAQDVIVSNRLHCLLLGACYGAVPVALTMEGHSKVVSLFRTVGWESLILRADDDACVDRFHQIRRDADRLRMLVHSTFAHQRRLGEDVLRRELGADGRS
jgi:hypothetical protein